MTQNNPVDYLAAIDQLRQEEKAEKLQIHTPDYIPARSDKPVDYLAASKAWEKEQAGTYKLHLQAGKRNPSHDPVYRNLADTDTDYLIS